MGTLAKGIQKNVAVLIGLLLIFSCSGACAAKSAAPEDLARILEKGTLVFGFIGDDRPPFYMAGSDGELQGLDAALARDIAAELGVQAVFDRSSPTYQDLCDKLTAGEVDVVFAKFSRTLARAITVRYTQPYVEFGRAIMLNKTFETREGIVGNPVPYLSGEGVRIAVVRSTAFAEYAGDMFPAAEIVMFDTAQQAVEAVVRGEENAFLYDEMEFARIASTQKDTLLFTSVYVFEDMREYICGAVAYSQEGLQAWLNVYLSNKGVSWNVDQIMLAYHDVFTAAEGDVP